MNGAVYKKIFGIAAKQLKTSKVVSPQQLNILGFNKFSGDIMEEFTKWGTKEGIWGRGFSGNVEQIPEIGKALITEAKDGIKLLKDPRTMQTLKAFSPSHYGEILHGVKNNPVIEATDCLNVHVKGMDDLFSWWKATIGKDKWGLGSFVPDNGNSISKRAIAVLEEEVNGKPIASWYHASSALSKKIDVLKKAFQKTSSVGNSAKIYGLLKKAEQNKSSIDAIWKPRFEMYAREVSELYPEARIAFYAEGHPEWKWLEPLLDTKEKQVARLTKDYFVKTRNRLDKLSIKVLPSEKGYVTHLASELGGIRERFFKSTKRLYIKKVLDFAHRQPESAMWFPALNKIMESYIPSSTKKIAFQPFHSKWSSYVNQLPKLGEKGLLLNNWWNSWFRDNLDRIGTGFEGKVSKIGNAWVKFEYARLIGLSLSVGFKHLLKMFGTPISHGFGPTVKAFGPTAKTAVQLARRTFGDVSNSGPEVLLASHYIRSRMALRAVFETPGMKRANMLLERIAAQPTMAVEAFDRGINLFATLHAGAKAGADFETIHKGILDWIMKINFVGGFDQFTWMKTPGRRAMFMFQMTPAKLFQYRWDLVKGFITGKKDIFGRSYGPMLGRAVMIYGLAEMMANQYDTSILWDQVLHFPFTTHTRSGETTVFKPPIVDFLMKANEHGLSGKGFALALRDHLEWLGTGSKLSQISSGEIPYKYTAKEGLSPEWRYILGLPSEERLTRQEKMEGKKKLKKDIRRIKKSQKTTWIPKKADKLLMDFLRGD